MKNIVNYLKVFSDRNPNKIAWTFLNYKNDKLYEENITNKEIYQKVYFYSDYLMKCGINRGDRVIIIAKQCPQTIYSIYSVLLCGGIFVLVPPIESKENRDRLEFTIKSAQSKYIMGDNNYNEKLYDKYDNYIDTSRIEDFILAKIKEINKGNNLSKDECANKFIEEILGKIKFPEISLSEIACLQYTSGSISDPKGVMLSHNNIIEGVKIQQEEYFNTDSDINVTWLPYFHTMELTCDIFFSLYTNRRNILMTTGDFMEKPARWFEVISRYKATITTGPISGYIAAVKDLEYNTEIDLSSLRYMISASEPVHKRDYEFIYDVLRKYGLKDNVFYTGLGMTEATTIITIEKGCISSLLVDIKEIKNNKIKIIPQNSQDARVLSSAGEIQKSMIMKIVNPNTLKECRDSEIGEIWIDGGCKACGYWMNEEKTKETFRAKLYGYENEFLRSGDLGYIHDNKLYITGRLKELLIINGHNIHVKDIEYVLRDNIEELNERIIQIFSVVKDNNENLVIAIEDENDRDYYSLIGKINKVILEYYNIEAYDVFFIKREDLPRTDNGKFAVNKTKMMYECKDINIIYSYKENNKVNSGVFTGNALIIKEIFEDILGVKCNSLKDNFFQLGGSSLKVIKLIKEIRSNFNITIKIDDIFNGPTIEKIEKFIKNYI